LNPLSFLEPPLESFLVFLNHQGGLTIGWAIIALTVVVRIVILPLFVAQYRSARRMQEIAPLVKETQKRFKHDRRKQQEEMMKLFQEHKVNPFGSCLPILFQAPVFIALFFVLRDFTQSNNVEGPLSFMGIIPNVETQFRDLGWRAAVLGLIYGVSQLLATEVSFATSPQTSEMQRKIFRFLPILIVGGLFLYPNVPAGLILYWLTTNLWTCGQQVVLKRRLGPLQLKDISELKAQAAVPEEAVTPRPKPKPKSKKSARPQASIDGDAVTAPEPTTAPEPAGGSQPKQKKPSGGGQRSNQKSRQGSGGGGQKSGQRRRPPKKR